MNKEKEVIKKIEKYFKNEEGDLEYELYCVFWADVIKLEEKRKKWKQKQ